MILEISLNGTDTNPYERLGLTQNPFPQITEYKYTAHCLQLQKLGGPPIPPETAENYIRTILTGWSQEFVDLVVTHYRPGELVKFSVEIPDSLVL